MLERLYRSSFGQIMSFLAQSVAWFQRPFMVYGFRDPDSGRFHKYTRISSNAVIVNRHNLSIGNHVWVSHYCILDATEGLTIEEGCQFSPWVGIFTHGSENSIRLLGHEYVNISNRFRKGYTRGAVKIGSFTYVGARSIILPGVSIGKGCLIAAGSIVTENVADYAYVRGQPAQVYGSTLDRDVEFFREHDYSQTYYDPQLLAAIWKRMKS